MGLYVDGFIIPVPKKNLKAYWKLAEASAKAWKKPGAVTGSTEGVVIMVATALPIPTSRSFITSVVQVLVHEVTGTSAQITASSRPPSFGMAAVFVGNFYSLPLREVRVLIPGKLGLL
jgi:hypothetical protein